MKFGHEARVRGPSRQSEFQAGEDLTIMRSATTKKEVEAIVATMTSVRTTVRCENDDVTRLVAPTAVEASPPAAVEALPPAAVEDPPPAPPPVPTVADPRIATAAGEPPAPEAGDLLVGAAAGPSAVEVEPLAPSAVEVPAKAMPQKAAWYSTGSVEQGRSRGSSPRRNQYAQEPVCDNPCGDAAPMPSRCAAASSTDGGILSVENSYLEDAASGLISIDMSAQQHQATTPFWSWYFEEQAPGGWCGMHVLNNYLGGPYVTKKDCVRAAACVVDGLATDAGGFQEEVIQHLDETTGWLSVDVINVLGAANLGLHVVGAGPCSPESLRTGGHRGAFGELEQPALV
jgi:hypothetical protein